MYFSVKLCWTTRDVWSVKQ